MKVSPKPPRQKKSKKSEKLIDEPEDDLIKTESESLTPSVIRQTKLEHMEIEIQPPTTAVDGQHFIIDDNITVESNIEIEFITSDDLLPAEMEAETIDYDNSDKNYENDFGGEIGDSQQDDGEETWENVRTTLSCCSE